MHLKFWCMSGPELPTEEIIPTYISWNSNFLPPNFASTEQR